MVSQKLLALTALLFIIKVCRSQAQCLVEYMNQPSAPPTLTTTSYVQPVSQFVIPAVIQPLQPDPYMSVMPPTVPDYSKFYNPISPVGGMPPIIFDNSNDGDGLDNLLYFLLFALRNKRNNGFGRSNGGGCGNSYGGNSCSCGNCNSCSGGGMSCGNSCNNCNSYGNCGGCGNCSGCGNCISSGKCSICGKSIGNGGFNNGNSGCSNSGNIMNGFPCGSNCIYIPVPIAVPIGGTFQCGNGSCGCTVHGNELFLGCDDCQSSSVQPCNGQNPNEINLIIRTDS